MAVNPKRRKYPFNRFSWQIVLPDGSTVRTESIKEKELAALEIAQHLEDGAAQIRTWVADAK